MPANTFSSALPANYSIQSSALLPPLPSAAPLAAEAQRLPDSRTLTASDACKPRYVPGERKKTALKYPQIHAFYQSKAEQSLETVESEMQAFHDAKTILKQDSLSIQLEAFFAQQPSYPEVHQRIRQALSERINQLRKLPATHPDAISDETEQVLKHYLSVKFGPNNQLFRFKYDMSFEGGIFRMKGTNLDASIVAAKDVRTSQFYFYQIPSYLNAVDLDVLRQHYGKTFTQDQNGLVKNSLGVGGWSQVKVARMVKGSDLPYDAVKISSVARNQERDQNGHYAALSMAAREAKVMRELPDSGYFSRHRGFVRFDTESHLLLDFGVSDGFSYELEMTRIVRPLERQWIETTLAYHYIAMMDKLMTMPVAAGQAPIKHRDIKPENILIRPFGSNPPIMLSDFGLSSRNPNYGLQTDGTMINPGSDQYQDPNHQDRNMHAAYNDLFGLGITVGTLAWHSHMPPETMYYAPRHPGQARPDWRGYIDTDQLPGDRLMNIYQKFCDADFAKRPMPAIVMSFPLFHGRVSPTLPKIDEAGRLVFFANPLV